MKQLVVLSGKGGAGKTCVTAALAHLAMTTPPPWRVVLVDADVDAANLELLAAPTRLHQEAFSGGQVAAIDPLACIQCGQCEQVCRYQAITQHDGQFMVNPRACEGCAACYYLCPTGAITRTPRQAGTWSEADSRLGPLFYAALYPGEENSGKLVHRVRAQGHAHAMAHAADLLLIDGPPGTGCPVISALNQADYCLLVTEPSCSGQHDLQRILDLAAHFRVPAAVVVNKADLYPPGSEAIRRSPRP